MYSNPEIILLIIGAVPVIYIAFTAWIYREQLLARLFFLTVSAVLWLIISYGLELMATNLPSKILWLNLQYISFAAIPLLWTSFIFVFTEKQSWLTKQRVLFSSTLMFLLVILIWTDPYHHLAWTQITINPEMPLKPLIVEFGIVNLLFTLICYLFTTVAAGYAINYWRQAAPVFRAQASLILLSFTTAYILSIIIIFQSPAPINWMVFAYILACIPVGYALFKHRLLDIMPAARDQIFKNIGDAVIVLDEQFRIIDINLATETMIGLPTSKIIGNRLSQLFPNIIKPLRKYKHILEFQKELSITIGGTLRYYDFRVSPLYDNNQKLSGRIILGRDITEQKQAKQQAVELELERSKVNILKNFISDTSHDLRNPITCLLNSSYLLTKYAERLNSQIEPWLRDAYKQQSQPIINTLTLIDKHADLTTIASNRLHYLVDSMYEMARLDRQHQLSLTTTDLNKLTESTLKTIRPSALKKSLQINFNPAPRLPALQIDPYEFPRIIENLAGNSIQYTPNNGHIDVKTYYDEKNVVLEVSDSGIGIKQEELPYIFDRFFRADSSRSAQTGGTGLGLAIVKKLVEAHHGTISVISAPDQGTSFYVRLPISASCSPN
ncbi:MAG: PAS domain-containing protein [Chloroflexi bacterium]|nr:PAS domain-containing protein [Chloroflexota bacterium]